MQLLELAFSHRSYVNENIDLTANNERLEFLGDSVLGLVVADYLFHLLPDHPEGYLARIKSYVVSENSLADIALKLKIDQMVQVGKGEEKSGGRTKKALLSDCLEAVFGAYYLDAGYSRASQFILCHLEKPIEAILSNRHQKDYKTLLQELVQKKFHSYPKYLVEKKTGPDHQRTFWMSVLVEGIKYGPKEGSNKKTAEQKAAQLAYQYLEDTQNLPKNSDTTSHKL